MTTENETKTGTMRTQRRATHIERIAIGDDRLLEVLERIATSGERTVQLLEAIEKHTRTSTGATIKAEQRLAQLVEIEHVALQLQLGDDDTTKKNPRG